MAHFPLPSNIGAVRTVFTNGTSAGLEINDVVPTNHSWYLLSVRHVLTKGGAGGTPTPMLQIADPAGNVVAGPWPGSSAGQALSTQTVYTWAPGLPLSAQLNAGGTHFAATAPLPQDYILGPGYQLQTTTINTVGGTSSYGTPCYFICELGTGL